MVTCVRKRDREGRDPFDLSERSSSLWHSTWAGLKPIAGGDPIVGVS
jgi:hypothetical protein